MTKASLRGLGAIALLALALLALSSGAPAGGSARPVHTYWIAAVPVHWNVVPNEHDAINHITFKPEETTFDTVVYKAFTPGFGRELSDRYAGIPGPTIHAPSTRSIGRA